MFHIKFGWMSKITIIHIGKISSSTSFLPGCSTQKTRHPTFGVSLLRAAQRTGPRGEKRPPPGRRRRARPGQGHGIGGWVKTGLLRLFWVSYLRCFWMCLIGDLRLFWGCSEVVLRLFWGCSEVLCLRFFGQMSLKVQNGDDVDKFSDFRLTLWERTRDSPQDKDHGTAGPFPDSTSKVTFDEVRISPSHAEAMVGHAGAEAEVKFATFCWSIHSSRWWTLRISGGRCVWYSCGWKNAIHHPPNHHFYRW